LGIISTREALETAFSQGLDLVEVAPEVTPPVCRIMDYGKHKYERAKKAKDAKKKQTVVQVKEIKMRPKTDEHDYLFKLHHIQEFLSKGYKIKVSLMFRGRELSHIDLGRKRLERLTKDLENQGTIEQPAKMEGKNMTMLVAPRPELKKSESASKSAAAKTAPPSSPPEGTVQQ
jgi:translation initiation factor IF-3